MAIEWQILGRLGADNALYAVVDSGQSRDSFLFDCGERTITDLRTADLQAIQHVCFSHFHMDHICGFDSFFRLNYNRPEIPVTVWGPPDTIRVMRHRLQGFTWNLHYNQPGEWRVWEIGESHLHQSRFRASEAFAEETQPTSTYQPPVIFQNGNWQLEARLLPHGSIRSAAYRIVEAPRRNIDPAALRDCGILPGPWLNSVINLALPDDSHISVDGKDLRLGDLRHDLITTTPGTSLAWVTDFRVEPNTADWQNLVAWLHGTTILVTECQYKTSDSDLAHRNSHMTSNLVGRLAQEASVKRLILQHFSKRYSSAEWAIMRDEARQHFPQTELPREWQIRS